MTLPGKLLMYISIVLRGSDPFLFLLLLFFKYPTDFLFLLIPFFKSPTKFRRFS